MHFCMNPAVGAHLAVAVPLVAHCCSIQVQFHIVGAELLIHALYKQRNISDRFSKIEQNAGSMSYKWYKVLTLLACASCSSVLLVSDDKD